MSVTPFGLLANSSPRKLFGNCTWIPAPATKTPTRTPTSAPTQRTTTLPPKMEWFSVDPIAQCPGWSIATLSGGLLLGACCCYISLDAIHSCGYGYGATSYTAKLRDSEQDAVIALQEMSDAKDKEHDDHLAKLEAQLAQMNSAQAYLTARQKSLARRQDADDVMTSHLNDQIQNLQAGGTGAGVRMNPLQAHRLRDKHRKGAPGHAQLDVDNVQDA